MVKKADAVDAAVGARIRNLRMEKGLTQVEFARAIGVTFQQVQKYENGSNRLSASRLYQIADALSVSVGELMTETGIARSSPDTPERLEETDHLLEAWRRITSARDRRLLLVLARQMAGVMDD